MSFVLSAGAVGPVRAQQAGPSYRFLASPDRVERLIAAWNERRPYVPGEVLVKFRPGVAVSSRAGVLSLLRAEATDRQETWIGDILLVRSSADPESDAVARQLALQPEVEWAQPNYLVRTSASPNDPGYSRQWNMDAIKMPQAWDINPGSGPTMTIAVVDTGITTTSETFTFPLWTGSQIEMVPVPVAVNPDIAQSRIAPGMDFVFWTGPVIDFVGHGTHVAGTALQETNNSVGLAGVAYQAKLLPLKVCLGYWDLQILASSAGLTGFIDPSDEGFCPIAEAAQAIRFAADNGAQVINLSLGGSTNTPLWDDAIRYAVTRGAFVSMAGGNSFEQGNGVEYPAALAPNIAGAMSVAAVGRSSRRSYYSNTGSYLEIAAPGGDIRDGGVPGMVFQTALFLPDFNPFTVIRPRFDRYAEVASQGTSMAAPHVAGVAALLYSQGIDKPAAIEAALTRFATDLGTPGRDDDFGNGLVNARASLRGLGVTR
jgi:serine protease